jgi:hypothetical protein
MVLREAISLVLLGFVAGGFVSAITYGFGFQRGRANMQKELEGYGLKRKDDK